MTQEEQEALKERENALIPGCKKILAHLTHCEYGSMEEYHTFVDLLNFAGIHDRVTKVEPEHPHLDVIF